MLRVWLFNKKSKQGERTLPNLVSDGASMKLHKIISQLIASAIDHDLHAPL